MRLTIVLAFLAIVIVACAPVEQPIDTPSPEEIPTVPDTQETSNDEDTMEDMDHSEMNTQEETIQDSEEQPTDMTEDAEVVFEVSGVNFAFTIDGQRNPDMIVNQGDRVRVEFTSASGVHDWVVDEFGATEIVQTGGSTFVEFVADQTGTFEYYCSVGSHRQQGMRGSFIVQ